MSLATRCTTCGTVFRVVQDQLKVSEGWVRCGRCNEVFNALQGLFDLERDTPPGSPAGSPEASAPASAALSTALSIDPSADPSADFSPDADAPAHACADTAPAPSRDDESTDAIDKIDAQLTRPRESAHDSTPATRINERDRLEFPDAQFDPDMLVDEPLEQHAASTEPVVADPSAATESIDTTDDAPGFVQQAQRTAHRQSPRMRGLQAAGVLLLVLGLGLQAAHQFRDRLAAQWPAAGPAFAAWCSAMRCTIEAPRRIDDVAVESTALARAPLPDAFQLSVVLRNRGATTVGLPSVDLSLTDANGQLVSRRMLAPNDFRSASAVIGPGAESSLQLLLSTGGANVAGYTVEVFYP